MRLAHSTLSMLLLVLASGCATPSVPPAPAKPIPTGAMICDSVCAQLAGVDAIIDSVTIYCVKVDAERRFSYDVQLGRYHGFLCITAGGKQGWGEIHLGKFLPGKTDAETLAWRTKTSGWMKALVGMRVDAAIRHTISLRPTADRKTLENAEMALLDLGGKLAGKPALELLGLTGRAPVPGLYCILNDDPAAVVTEAKRAKTQNLHTHLKVKLYGKPAVDAAVIRAARSVYGPTAYIVGDVNMGYRSAKTDSLDRTIPQITAAMIALRDAGLSACEDPAEMTPAEWATVQAKVGKLELLPDVPLRPSWKALQQINPAMGRVFNMHPSCMGSVIETASLGRTIQSWKRRLMVGDASLVGPACVAWEQIAIGLGADWVEAIEKPQENNVFGECLIANPVKRTAEGKFALPKPAPGFGTVLDTKKLAAKSILVINVKTIPTPAKKK